MTFSVAQFYQMPAGTPSAMTQTQGEKIQRSTGKQGMGGRSPSRLSESAGEPGSSQTWLRPILPPKTCHPLQGSSRAPHTHAPPQLFWKGQHGGRGGEGRGAQAPALPGDHTENSPPTSEGAPRLGPTPLRCSLPRRPPSANPFKAGGGPRALSYRVPPGACKGRGPQVCGCGPAPRRGL